MLDRRAVGLEGEAVARRFLKGLGFRIVEENFNCPLGEIDLIVEDGDILVFVEVKTRRSTRFGTPAEAVHARKQRQILRVAEAYMRERRFRGPCRVDVVAVEFPGQGTEARVELIRNAVQGTGRQWGDA
ncbi:MAG: YraN family protein [candidate division NC10 bacterium]|nr:YraN family protein [candidate division NC10 bacterium]HET7854021.1 YraN family protein [Candidatus Methylomirabilis sp.]